MKYTVVTIVAAAVACLVGLGHAQSPASSRKWLDSFDQYKSTVRSLDKAATKACESELRHILTSIDQNQTCSVDSDCTLAAEEPFGPVVPVRTMSKKTLMADMSQFRRTCYDESRRVHYNSDLVHRPACVNTRCMVKTAAQP